MTMGEKIMYPCMCNWVPMLYSRKKKCAGGNNNKKINKNKLVAGIYFGYSGKLPQGVNYPHFQGCDPLQVTTVS